MFLAIRNCHTEQTISPIAGFNAMPQWSQNLDRSYVGKATETMLRGAASE